MDDKEFLKMLGNEKPDVLAMYQRVKLLAADYNIQLVLHPMRQDVADIFIHQRETVKTGNVKIEILKPRGKNGNNILIIDEMFPWETLLKQRPHYQRVGWDLFNDFKEDYTPWMLPLPKKDWKHLIPDPVVKPTPNPLMCSLLRRIDSFDL